MATKDLTNTIGFTTTYEGGAPQQQQQQQTTAPTQTSTYNEPRYSTPVPVGGKSFMDHLSLAEGGKDFAGGLADTIGGTLGSVGNLMAAPLSFKDGSYDTTALKNAGGSALRVGTGLLNTVGGLGKALGGLALDPLRMFGLFGGEESQPQTPVDPDPVAYAIEETFSDKPADWISDEAWERGKRSDFNEDMKQAYNKYVPENWNNVRNKAVMSTQKSYMSPVPGSTVDVLSKYYGKEPEEKTGSFLGTMGIFPGVNWSGASKRMGSKAAPKEAEVSDTEKVVEDYAPATDKDTLELAKAVQTETEKAPANAVYTKGESASQVASDPDFAVLGDTKWLSNGFRPYPNMDGKLYKVLPSGKRYVLFDQKTGKKTVFDISTNTEVTI